MPHLFVGLSADWWTAVDDEGCVCADTGLHLCGTGLDSVVGSLCQGWSCYSGQNDKNPLACLSDVSIVFCINHRTHRPPFPVWRSSVSRLPPSKCSIITFLKGLIKH